MDIALHIGAHKTASTYLQGVLSRNADRLGAMGVGHVEAMKFRRQVTAKLGKSGKRADAQHAAAIAAVQGMLADAGQPRVILSDENLLGSPERLETDRALYLDPGRKLAPLADALHPHRVTVFMAVRNLAEFTSSVLLECFRTGRYAPELPDTYARDWLSHRRGWADVVADVAALFPQASVVVWNHWQVFHHMDEVLREICGTGGALALEMSGAPRRPSPSRAAVAALLRGADPVDPAARMKALAAAMAAHPRTPDNPVFSLWGEGEAAVWQARFREDLARIRQMGPQVRLLEWNA